MDYREILFKGQRTDNGEWVEGCRLIDYVTGQHFIHAKGNGLNAEKGVLNFFAYEVNPETVCESSGFKSRNGRHIFENDLLGPYKHRVLFLNGSWSIDGDRLLVFHKEDEIVGNYFDQAERLYVEVAHFEESGTVDRFNELERQDPDSAVSFLSQWDYGENDGDPETLSQMIDGLFFVNIVEWEDYMAIWQLGVTGVTLYRRVRSTGRPA